MSAYLKARLKLFNEFSFIKELSFSEKNFEAEIIANRFRQEALGVRISELSASLA